MARKNAADTRDPTMRSGGPLPTRLKPLVGGDHVEGAAFERAPRHELRDRRRVPDAVVELAADLHQAIGIRVGQSPHQQAVRDGEDRGRGPDGQGQRDERHERRRAIAGQDAERVPDLGEERAHECALEQCQTGAE
jgi:hypothetical protein